MAARSILVGAGLLLIATPTVWAQAPSISWELDEAIKQIERQADDFETAMARVVTVVTDADGNETSTSTGTGFIHEDGTMRYNIDGGQKVTLVDRYSVQVYDAAANQVEEYSLRKHKDRLEPLARLGFSTTGKEMKDDYLLTIRGEEDIGDARTIVLELTPESEKTRQTVRLIRLWIDQASWMPVQQEFSSTNGNTLTLTYTGMARNLELRPELFKDDWPRGTEKINK
jgi:outer membrane lipoprotein-sorting protein